MQREGKAPRWWARVLSDRRDGVARGRRSQAVQAAPQLLPLWAAAVLSPHRPRCQRTSRQLSRRTVSMPLVSILSHFSGLVHSRPAYLHTGMVAWQLDH